MFHYHKVKTINLNHMFIRKGGEPRRLFFYAPYLQNEFFFNDIILFDSKYVYIMYRKIKCVQCQHIHINIS